jgi:hypothetical protein
MRKWEVPCSSEWGSEKQQKKKIQKMCLPVEHTSSSQNMGVPYYFMMWNCKYHGYHDMYYNNVQLISLSVKPHTSDIWRVSDVLQVLPLFSERLQSLEQCLMDVGQGTGWPPLSIVPVYLIGVAAAMQVRYHIFIYSCCFNFLSIMTAKRTGLYV